MAMGTTTSGPVSTSTGMGDCLWMDKLLPYVTSHPGQLMPSTLSGMVNEYRPKCSDVQRQLRQAWLIPTVYVHGKK